MDRHARRVAVLLSLMLILVACSSGQQHTTQDLNDRMQAELAPDIGAGNVALQALPDGDRITLLGSSQFPVNVRTLDDQLRDVRSSVVEGLLDPRLMRISVVDTSGLPPEQRQTRVNNVVRYFEAYGLAPSIQPAPPQQPLPAATAPPGLIITVGVLCPHSYGEAGYGNGKADPMCD
jgi:hypothetical protein